MLPLGFVNVHVTSLKSLQKLMIFWLKPLWLAHFFWHILSLHI